MSLTPLVEKLHRDMQDMIRDALRQLKAEQGMAGGMLSADNINGTLPTSTILHALQSTVHTDVDHTTFPLDGQVLVWSASAAKWIPGTVMGGSGGNSGELLFFDGSILLLNGDGIYLG